MKKGMGGSGMMPSKKGKYVKSTDPGLMRGMPKNGAKKMMKKGMGGAGRKKYSSKSK